VPLISRMYFVISGYHNITIYSLVRTKVKYSYEIRIATPDPPQLKFQTT